MKNKIINKLYITVGVLAGAATMSILPLVETMGKSNRSKLFINFSNYNKAKEFSAKNHFKKYDTINTKNIMSVANSADINMFSTRAVAPFNNMMRLSLLAKTEVHFYPLWDDSRESFQEKINVSEFENFLKNNKKTKTDPSIDKITSNMERENYEKSSVEPFHWNKTTSDDEFYLKQQKIILKNKDKKINIWFNSWQIDHGDKYKIMDLSGYSNVNIQLIEDGTAAIHYPTQAEKYMKTHKTFVNNGDRRYMGSAPAYFKNVYSWGSFDDYKKTTIATYKHFEYKELSDMIFSNRDKQNTRLMKIWPKISGLNWRDALKTMENAHKMYKSKKDMILLGSYGVQGEDLFIMKVWEKYQGNYNIYYKGHPGHMEHPLWVSSHMLSKPSMFQLEPMISSEQLTRDHVGKGLKFDAIAMVGLSGAFAKSKFPNIKDLKTKLLAYLPNQPGKNVSPYFENKDILNDNLIKSKIHQWETT